jgi:hypothetical protein
MDQIITLSPTGKLRSKGQVYDAIVNGEVIASGVSPECAACRELQKRGHGGIAYFTRSGAPYGWDLRMSISWGAKRYVAEDRTGIRFAKWTEFSMGDISAPD